MKTHLYLAAASFFLGSVGIALGAAEKGPEAGAFSIDTRKESQEAVEAAPGGSTAPASDEGKDALTDWTVVSVSIPKDGDIKDAYVELKSPDGRTVTLTQSVSSKEGVTLAKVDWTGSPIRVVVSLRKRKEHVELFAEASLVSKKDNLRKKPAQIEIESKFIEITDAVAERLKFPGGESFMGKRPALAAPAVLSGVLNDKDAGQFLATLMVEKGAGPDGAPSVDVLSAPRVTTHSQQRAVIEIIREFRYPTDFNPPDATNTKWTSKDFVTRNVGVTLRVEPVLNDADVIDLNVAPEVVEFLGFADFETKAPLFTAKRDHTKPIAERNMGSLSDFTSKGRPYIPIFSTRKAQVNVSIFPGSTVVLSVSGESDDIKPFKPFSAGRQLVVLIRASIVDPEALRVSQQEESAPEPNPKSSPEDGILEAKPVEGKPGFVTSPYAPKEGYIDVRGFPTGTEVKCPYTGNLLRVP